MELKDRTQSARARRTKLAGVIAAMAVVNLVYGIAFPLFALVLDGQGISRTLIGLSTLCQAAAIFVVAPLAPRLLNRFEPARLMQTVSAAVALLFVIAGLYPNVWFWFPVRFLIGAFNSLLWITSEALINDLAEERWRGRVISIYSSAGAAGFALGPLVLILTGSDGFLPFATTSGLVALAAVPLWAAQGHLMGGSAAEGAPAKASAPVWRMFVLAPVIMLANVVYAAAAESMVTFFPLFGVHMGISENFSLGLMTTWAIGSMILILPLGWLADHVNRLGLLVACLALTMFGLLVMPYVLQPAWLASGAFFVIGGVEGMIYSLGVTLVGERFKGRELSAASSSFTAAWGLGTVVGPILVGAGMDALGGSIMPIIIVGFFAAYLPLPVTAWAKSMKTSK